MDFSRRDFIETAGLAAAGAAVSSAIPAAAQSNSFNIMQTFAGFMRDIGGAIGDAGGKVSFTGADPIIRSHFRVGSAMAIPAMGAGLGAAAIWRERTGQSQDLTVDLRESIYNVNPLIGAIKLMAQRDGLIPASFCMPVSVRSKLIRPRR